MFRRSLFSVALVLATVSLAAQTSKPASQSPKPSQASKADSQGAKTGQSKPGTQSQQAASRYVPAVMQQRMTTLSGCLRQNKQDYTLTDVKVSQQGDAARSETASAAASYTLEGISAARLSLLVGKRVDVTGAFQEDPKAAAGSKSAPRFEATAVVEASGSCS